MRRTMTRGVTAALATLLLALPAMPAGASPAAPPPAPDGEAPLTTTDWAGLGLQQVPKEAPGGSVLSGKAVPEGVNPYTALVPDPGTVDWAYWRAVAEAKGEARAQMQAQAQAAGREEGPLVYNEVEPPTVKGQNDSRATAERVARFGTGRNRNPIAQLLGTLAPSTVTPVVVPSVEDDGSIPLANVTGIGAGSGAAVVDATIGDGPHGSAGSDTGDFDFFKLTGMTAGQRVVLDVDTPTGPLDSLLVLWTATGEVVAFNDDSAGSLDSQLDVTIPAPGDYYATVAGFPSLPEDPFDSGSGVRFGSEGPYHLAINIDTFDTDFYAVDLRAGDVVGASVSGGGTSIALFDPSGRQMMGSTQDATFILPGNSPLPGGGNATLDHVTGVAGRYTLRITGISGAYQVALEAYRHEERQERNAVQTLFVDFDGARVNTGIFGGPGVRQLSPLSAFLANWGLTPADEDALIDAILATVRENVRADLAARGGNPRFDVRIRNSRDHADTFGQPNNNVSRLVVGGTIAESGINTIGIAQFIDPGNFSHEDTALILLDVLSRPRGPVGDPSLNSYITPASDRIAFLGRAIGNVVSHEAGHYLGNWHVDQFDGSANIMDQGGNFPVLYGVGPDNVGGTADDPDVDFGDNPFNPGEGFTGIEETLVRTAFGLSKGRGFEG
jgi:hypothetical protein